LENAHLAALAIQYGCEIASADNDFLRFPGVVLVIPWQASSNAS
jgi:predicted nucleic acid-binding protein